MRFCFKKNSHTDGACFPGNEQEFFAYRSHQRSGSSPRFTTTAVRRRPTPLCSSMRSETDGIVVRKVYPQVPPKVEYSLTTWGQALCPALDAILKVLVQT
jgi:HxlR-like helix-turn-helix